MVDRRDATLRSALCGSAEGPLGPRELHEGFAGLAEPYDDSSFSLLSASPTGRSGPDLMKG